MTLRERLVRSESTKAVVSIIARALGSVIDDTLGILAMTGTLAMTGKISRNRNR